MQLCLQTKNALCLPSSPSLSFFVQAEARSEALHTEQARPLPHPRGRLRRCQESTGGDPEQWYENNPIFLAEQEISK